MAMAELQDRFHTLINEHKRILYKVCNSYCRNREDREDLSQEIVIQLWRSFGTFDEHQRFSTWMYRIALKLSLSPFSSGRLPLILFSLSAVCQALITTSPILPMAWLSDEYMLRMPSSCSHGFTPDPRVRERDILGYRRVEVVTEHRHIERLGQAVYGERPCRSSGRRKREVLSRYHHDVWRVSSACAFGVVGVNRSSVDRIDGVGDVSAFIERVCVYGHLGVGQVCRPQ